MSARFEDTRAGWIALAGIVIVGLIVVGFQFYAVMIGGAL